MGIFGNLFGEGSDFGTRLALAGQALSALDQGQVANLGPSIAALGDRRREIASEIQKKKWLQTTAAALADKNPAMAKLLQDAPPEVGSSLVSEYYKTLLAPPEWKTFESGGDLYRYNPGDPASKPELFFNAPDKEDPFTGLLKSIAPPAQGAAPAASVSGGAAAPPPPAASAVASGGMPPEMQAFADAMGLSDATPDEVEAVRRAGLVGGIEQARTVAAAIRQKKDGASKLGFDMTKEQASNAFKLQDDYWRVGQSYRKIIDTAAEVATLPDDPNAYERLVTMYKFMRTLDPMGAVREGDAALAQSAAGPMAQLDQLMEKYSGVSGGDIPMSAAQEMKRLILQIGETTAQADYKVRQKTLRRAEAIGIPQDKAEGMIFGGLDENVDMSGYKPRFDVPVRPEVDPMLKTDAAPAVEPGAPEPPKPGSFVDLDPSVMKEGVEYQGDDGKAYMKRNGKVWVNDGKSWQEYR